MAIVTIDNREVEVKDAISILDAARSIGIDIPTFCFQARLSGLASCRLCLVEIEGQRKLQPSCVTPVMDGMVIKTNTPAVVESRRAMLEFILANHPLDCPVCDKAGECELQDMVFTFGPREGRFSDKKRRFHEKDYRLNSVVVKNANRCVQCQRCVRMCEEIVGAVALGAIGRGAWTEETGFVKSLEGCDHCGNCIEVCPVGSLMNYPYRYKSRPWDLAETDTICPYCGTGCHITVGLRDGNLMRVRSKKDTGINRETLCVKGRFGIDFITDEHRIKRPMVRKNNTLVPVSWRETWNCLQEKLSALIGSKKPVGGLASPRYTNEVLYTFQKLMRTVFKTNSIDSSVKFNVSDGKSPDLYEVLGDIISQRYSRVSLSDALDTDAVLILGGNITDENPVTDYTLRYTLSKKNLKLFIASIRPTRLDTDAGAVFRHLPGEESFILAGVLNGIIGSNKTDVLDKTFNNFETFKNAVKGSGNGGLTGLGGFIKDLVSGINTSKRISLFIGGELLRSSGASTSVQMLHNLINILDILKKVVNIQFLFDLPNQLGAWDMGVMPNMLPGYRRLDDSDGKGLFEKDWGVSLPSDAGDNFVRMMERSAKGEMGGLYILGEDPVLTYPDVNVVKDALSKLDLLIVQDAFLTETAKMADIVLPGSTFAENDGTFTNNEGRLQRVRGFHTPAFDSKKDIEILSHVASLTECKRVPSSSTDAFEEILRLIEPYKGINLQEIGGDGTMTHNSKAESLKKLYVPKISTPERTKALRLVTGNNLFHSGHLSERSRTLKALLDRPFVEINREDAADFNVEDGEDVLVCTRDSDIKVKVRTGRSFPRGVAFIPDNFKDVRLNRLFKRGEYPVCVEIKKV